MTALYGKVVLVTGASKGMGRHFVGALVAAGAKVVGLARPSAEIDSLQTEHGRDVLAIGCDVSAPDQVNHAVERAVDHFGKLDILVNNAAIFVPFAFDQGGDKIFRQHLDVNILGVAWPIRAAIPHLRKTCGQIVTISSESVHMPFPMLALYAGTKAAVELMSQGLRDELRGDGIRVGILRSGTVAGSTGGADWGEDATKQFYDKIVQTGHAAMAGTPASPQSMAAALIAMVSLPADVSVDLMVVRAAQAGMPDGALAAVDQSV